MLIILPIAALIILVIIFNKQGNCWRSSVLLSALIWGTLLTFITESLSAFKLLTFGGLAVLWGLTNLILGLIYWQLTKQKKQTLDRKENQKIPIFLTLLLSALCSLVAAVGLIAILAAPNNWDSMTYHLVRVGHWIENRTVEHYPTHYLPQLYLMPWSEYVIAHFQILSGGDRFANLVQWLSMVGSIIGVSLITKELGADIRGQIFAAVFCATIPMGILQASSTQSDYVVTFWLVCLVYYILQAVKAPINNRLGILIGISLGLAMLTKGTAYLYAFPFLIWLLLGSIKQVYWKKLGKPFLIIAFLALFLNLGYYTRNFQLFGSPLGSTQGFEATDDPQGFKYTNDAVSVPILISNVVRNMAIHADIVRNLGLQRVIPPTTGATEKVIQIIHKILGVDINDPRTTRHGPFQVPGLSTNEDTAGNPLHFFLILLLIPLLFGWKRLRENRYLLIFTLSAIAAFFLFCFQLKWQPYHSRLHLSLFVLLAAFVGSVLDQIPPRKIANSVAVILIITSLNWVLYNKMRPLLGDVNVFNQSRIEQYFIERSYLLKPYSKMTNFISNQGCANVGLLLEDHWEYPIWMMWQQTNHNPVNFEHINVKNISRLTENLPPHNNFIPCAVIYKKYKSVNKSQPQQEIIVKDRIYTRKWSSAPISVYLEKKTLQ